MNVLLDTNSLLWASSNKKSHSLGKRAKRVISKADVVYYSSVSIAEISIKSVIGKIKPVAVADVIKHGFVELPLTSEHAEAIANFQSLARHDPFDRMLLAQAYIERLTFLTADRALLGLGLPHVVDVTE